MHEIKTRKPVPPLEIDYSKTVQTMIADGEYSAKNNGGRLPEKLPGAPCHKVVLRDAQLVCVGERATGTEILKTLNADGLRPARLEELLALGAANKEAQTEFPIAALGTILPTPNYPENVGMIGLKQRKPWGVGGPPVPSRYFWLRPFVNFLSTVRFLAVPNRIDGQSPASDNTALASEARKVD